MTSTLQENGKEVSYIGYIYTKCINPVCHHAPTSVECQKTFKIEDKTALKTSNSTPSSTCSGNFDHKTNRKKN